MDKKLNKPLQDSLKISFKVNEKKPKKKIIRNRNSKIDKETFCKIVQLLEEADEASAQMFDAGIDLSIHESRFFDIIESLLYLVLTEKQISLIHLYLFGDTYIKDIPISLDSKGNPFEPETPEELWIAINNIV